MDSPLQQDQWVPQDPGDITSIPNIEALDAATFAALIPDVFAKLASRHRRSKFIDSFRELIRHRINEPPVISTLASILKQLDNSETHLNSVEAAIDCVAIIPADQQLPFRPALVHISELESGGRRLHYRTSALALKAKDMIRFMDDPTAVWAPQHKFDVMSLRTLEERVHTAEQMRPHVYELLCWLQDANWPPFSVIKKHRGEGDWILHMLEFVEQHVPMGPLWEGLSPQVQELTKDPVGDEEDWELPEYAAHWVEVLNEWKEERDVSAKG